jgi:hypothetical protein
LRRRIWAVIISYEQRATRHEPNGKQDWKNLADISKTVLQTEAKEDAAEAENPKLEARSSRLVAGRWLWALLGATALTLIYCRVAVFNLGAGVIGGDLDGYENMWNDWWVRYALLDLGRNPLFFTDYLYYPTGISLRYHTLNPLNGLFALPLWTLFGAVVSTNLKFILSIILTCFCAWLFIREVSGHSLGAFAGAALFTFANDQLIGFYTFGQAEKLSMWWFPLYLFFIYRLMTRPPLWLYLALGVATLLAMSLTDWQFVLYAAMVTAGWAFFGLFGRRAWREKILNFGKLAAVGIIWAAIVAVPFLLPMLREAQENPWLAVGEQSLYRARALSEFFSFGTGNPGWLAAIVIIVGLIFWWRTKPAQTQRETVFFWGIAAFLAAILTLGPVLIWTPLPMDGTPLPPGAVTAISLPYSIIQKLPVLSIGRDPGRYYMITLLGVGVLTAFAIQGIAGWLRPNWQKFVPLGVGLLVAISLAGFMVEAGKAKTDPFDPPPFYSQLANDPDDYAIMELPLFTEKGRGENTYQAYQIVHNKPRLGGRYARDHKLTNPNNFAKRTTLFRDFFWHYQRQVIELFRPVNGIEVLPPPDFGEISVPLLNFYKVRYIIFYKEAMQATNWQVLPASEKLVKQALGENVQPVYEDAKIRAYRVPDAPASAKPFLDIGSTGWYAAEANADSIFRWANTCNNLEAEKARDYAKCQNVKSELLLFNLGKERVKTKMQFMLVSYKNPVAVTLFINGYRVDSYKIEPNGSREVTVELDAPPGANSLTFTSDITGTPVGTPEDARLLSFGVSKVSLQP